MDRFDQSLKYIRLRNFMVYEQEKQFDFSPGINAITGDNDKGKSTILAAVGWVLFGAPGGDTVETWDGDRNTFVELSFADSLTISRHREKGINFYRYQNGGKKGEFRAAGNSVPEEVKQMIQLQEINFQGQANNLFPMQLTPGQFGALVNEHCRLDEIHETLSRLHSEQKKDEKDLGLAKQEIEQTEKEIQALNWVPSAEGQLEVANSLNQRIGHLLFTQGKVRGYIEQSVLAGNALARIKKTVGSLTQKIGPARVLAGDIGKLQTQLEKTGAILGTLRHSQAQKEKQQKTLRAKPLVEQAIILQRALGILNCKIDQVEEIDNQLWQRQLDMDGAKSRKEQAAVEIKEIKEQLPPICPLCGNQTKGAEHDSLRCRSSHPAGQAGFARRKS